MESPRSVAPHGRCVIRLHVSDVSSSLSSKIALDHRTMAGRNGGAPRIRSRGIECARSSTYGSTLHRIIDFGITHLLGERDRAIRIELRTGG